MNDLDRLIHEPARLTIIALLSSVKEADFLYLLRETGLTKGNLSTHLVRLEEGGYVDIEKTFRGKIPLTLLRLSSEGRAAFQSYRKSMKDILAPSKAPSKVRRIPVQLPT
jgi:DNA-binding transcriptional ArsR family regulator